MDACGFDIEDRSKEDLCAQIAAIVLGPNLEKGPKAIHIIGSTNAVAAFVFRLEREHQFAAVPHDDSHMTVIEMVTETKIMVRQQNKNKKEQSIITELKDRKIILPITPQIIQETADAELKLVLRFHSFGIDAKAESIHGIYQELVVALGSNQGDVIRFQKYPRIAFIETQWK